MRPAGAGRAMVSAVLYRKPRPGGGGGRPWARPCRPACRERLMCKDQRPRQHAAMWSLQKQKFHLHASH